MGSLLIWPIFLFSKLNEMLFYSVFAFRVLEAQFSLGGSIAKLWASQSGSQDLRGIERLGRIWVLIH